MDPDSPSSPAGREPQAAPRRSEERRVVTTLFCDLVGFTSLSDRNDAELVASFLRRYYAVSRKAIEAYGGTVEKYIGDAVVAVFGVPTLHEDDPERAVRAGLRLVDEVDALPGIGGQAVEVRVGINTGEVLVRLDVDTASGEGFGFLAGDAVNVAARLQSAAPPMAVAVGEGTHAATERVFAYEACHPVALKGKAQSLSAWIATAPLARTGSELRSFASAFVGREEELAALQALLDEAAEGQQAPRLGLVVGEPGIGKSRLLAEFARRLDDRPTLVTWHQGRCLPFGANVTFWALSQIVRDSAGVLESDGVARTEARLETILPEGPDRDRLRSRLRPLLGLEAEEASREENFAAWRAFLEGLAVGGPAIVVVEDLHWADEAMLAFMEYLAQSEASVPLLVLASGRPEVLELSGPGATFVATATRLHLGPLSGEQTSRLLLARLGATSLPVSLQAKLLEGSGGNPLFAEELVRLLQDRGLLETHGDKVALKAGADVSLPDSIDALIAARLGLLSAERKALLADAAIVGRTFWVGAVAAVAGSEPAQVYESLIELVAKELVRPERASSIEGETEFTFAHALVCDVAYSQLTRADRAVKHAALAKWLEERTAGRTEDLAEVLAYHYGTALELASACGLELEDELLEPTSRYLELAGGRAAPLDSAAAAAHFARAERVTAAAQRPRRFLLSRRTRRTLRRRAPLLVGAGAVIAAAAVAAIAIWAFAPSKTPNPASAGATGPTTQTGSQIASKHAIGVVRITTQKPVAAGARLRWKHVSISGVAVSKDGLIYTSGEAFVNAALPAWRPVFVTVEYYDLQGMYRKVRGVLLGVDPLGNVAVVKVDTEGAKLRAVPLGDSQSVTNGEPVVSLCRRSVAQGFFVARTMGAISGDSPVVPENRNDLQAPVLCAMHIGFQSETGGALIDSSGHLIGVTGGFRAMSAPEWVGRERWKTLKSRFTGRDVAVAVGLFQQEVPRMQLALQREPAAWLGVVGTTVRPALGPALGPQGGRGVLVEFVSPGSPAEKAGIVAGSKVKTVAGKQHVVGGDVIVAINAAAVRSANDLVGIERRIGPETSVSVHLLRRRSPMTVQVKLVANPLRTPAPSYTWTPGAEPAPAVTYPPQPAQDTSGYLDMTDGWQFKPSVDILVTALGFYDDGQDGLHRSRPVGIFDGADQWLLASVEVRPDSPLEGVFRWEPVTPLVLHAGHTYVAAAYAGPPFDGEVESPEGQVWAAEVHLVAGVGSYATGWMFPAVSSEILSAPAANFKFLPASLSSPSP
jgi:class 3 adenylate cyclase/S1-C subfamily serine protease